MTNTNRWLNSRNEGGKVYDAKFEMLQESGLDIHGEANFVMRYQPKTVLDAGCGTGRVAIELARQGCATIGIDIDAEMLARAKEKAPELDWRLADLAVVQLAQKFELIVMAGNVLLFVAAGTEEAVILNLSRQIEPAGRLVSGFQLNRELELGTYDEICERTGLHLKERYINWQGQAWQTEADYAVSVHQKEA